MKRLTKQVYLYIQILKIESFVIFDTLLKVEII